MSTDKNDTARRVRKPNSDEILFGALLGGTTDGAIERQEERGQRSLVDSDQLPVDGTRGKEETWRKIGVELGPVPDDSLFRDVTLPPGWRKVPTEHAMWSHLLDDRGRVRAKIFYKAAFYDQRADVRIERRFVVDRVYGKDPDDSTIEVEVLDAGTRVHVVAAGNPGHRPPDLDAEHAWWQEGQRLEEGARDECRAWLAERGYTDINDPAAYWDEPAPR
jgi:hypothetical protein